MKSPIKVAIIEDDPCNQHYLEMVVARMHYQAVKIYDMSSIIEDLIREKPHLVLLDIKLSNNLSGIDVAEKMKKNKSLKNIPIIVVSAFALEDEIKEIKAKTHCNDYVVKPFLVDKLTDAINEQLCSVYGAD